MVHCGPDACGGDWMKRYFTTVFIVLAVCLCLGYIGYYYNLSAIQIRLVGSKDKTEEHSLKYHFVLIAQDTNDSFWQSIKNGAQLAAKKHNAALEYNGTLINDESESLAYLNVAIASHVDGIVVYVTDEMAFTPLINKAVAQGIPVITIESDDKNSKRQAFVGPDNYAVGNSEGNLIAMNMHGVSNVAMIIGGNYARNNGSRTNLLNGFNDRIKDDAWIQVKTIQITNTGYFAAENLIRDILNQYPEVNTIVSTDYDDTLEILQVFNDLNKEGDYTLIGYGNTQKIRDYIKNGDIFGSVYEDSENTGYKSIENLIASLSNQDVPSFVDTGIYTITRGNLLTYPQGS